MRITGECKLCLEGAELLESHFMSRKLYYSGGKKLQYISLLESGIDPEELKAHLLCRKCEHRLSVNGESEVLKHVKPKYVLKPLPLSERMRVALPQDNDPSAPRFDARDFGIDTDKFAYFALSLVWRRTIHEWSPAIPKWELGQFAEDMRRYLVEETPLPKNMAVIVMVCKDKTSRSAWTVPQQFVELGCLNFRFMVRGIFFRVLMGRLPRDIHGANCVAPRRPIFWADCEKRIKQDLEGTEQAQKANRQRADKEKDR
jgi:hypothetical protein